MKIFDTNIFRDGYKESILDYYRSIITDDAYDQVSSRAILECKVYSLPFYFTMDPVHRKKYLPIKSPLELEQELMYISSTVNGLKSHREACPECGKYVYTITLNEHKMCKPCWMSTVHTIYAQWINQITWAHRPSLKLFALRDKFYESYKPPGYEWFWEIEFWKDLCEVDHFQEFKENFAIILTAKKSKIHYGTSYSPKHTLMAVELGCNVCGKVHEADSLWADPAIGWMNGLCPDCRPIRGTWYVSKYEPHGYNECVRCATTAVPHALWGLCEGCYVEWQDSYLNPKRIWELAQKYGTTATLLIRPEVEWVRWVRKNLPPYYTHHMDYELTYEKPTVYPKVVIKDIVKGLVGCSITKEHLLSLHRQEPKRR